MHQPRLQAALNRATSPPLVDSLKTCPGPCYLISPLFPLDIEPQSFKIRQLHAAHEMEWSLNPLPPPHPQPLQFQSVQMVY